MPPSEPSRSRNDLGDSDDFGGLGENVEKNLDTVALLIVYCYLSSGALSA